METKFTKQGNVLDGNGYPNAGYSTTNLLKYDRTSIKAKPWRIKEWDFYQVTDDKICVQLTIGHAAYAGQISVMIFDFKLGIKLAEKNHILALPFGKLHMPSNTEESHTLGYSKGKIDMSFETKGHERRLICNWEDIKIDIVLLRKNPNSIVVNIPFKESKTAFYYNQKINCMTAEGSVWFERGVHHFKKETSYGLLDWGRGVWPFHNEWYWSNGTGYVNGEIFGFNLGCGFGDTSHATENIIFYRNTTHKLGEVVFEVQKDYMEPWHIYDKDGRLDIKLTPSYDRTTKMKVLWVDNCCHQMFGKFNGFVILDDGMKLMIDDVISFAEHAMNNW